MLPDIFKNQNHQTFSQNTFCKNTVLIWLKTSRSRRRCQETDNDDTECVSESMFSQMNNNIDRRSDLNVLPTFKVHFTAVIVCAKSVLIYYMNEI